MLEQRAIGETARSDAMSCRATPPTDDPIGLAWFVSFGGDQAGAGRWSGPHGTEAEANADAGRLARLGYDPIVWSETAEQRAESVERERVALARHQAKLKRIRAVHVGTRIGEGMAADAIANGQPATWSGFDPRDCESLFDAGIKPDCDAWLIAERSARLAFDRAMSDDERPSRTDDDADPQGTPPDQP